MYNSECSLSKAFVKPVFKNNFDLRADAKPNA
jgi:hypothetical protein